MNDAPSAAPISAPVCVSVELANAVASAMPRPSYLDWTLWAWGVLAHAGQATPDLSEWPNVEDVITFAALAGAFTRFANILDDVPEVEADSPELLSGPRAQVTETDLGRYCERHGIYTGEVPESADELLSLAIAARAGEVLTDLRGLIGNAACYASLRQAIEGPATWAEDGDDGPGLPWQRDAGLWANDTDEGLAHNRWQLNLSAGEVGLRRPYRHEWRAPRGIRVADGVKADARVTLYSRTPAYDHTDMSLRRRSCPS